MDALMQKAGRMPKKLSAFLEYMNGRETENDFVKSLKEQIETFKHNNRMREEYMYRMTVEDEIRHDALQECMQQGIAQGVKQGMQKGIQQGITQGENKRNADIVLNMLSQGFDVQTISKCTKLKISEIERIKNKV